MSFAHLLPIQEAPVHRQSPHNIEVEQALLGAILINNEAFYRVSDFLDPAHFYDPLHRQIYEKSSQLIRLGRSEEHTSELQSRQYLVCRLLLEKKNIKHC